MIYVVPTPIGNLDDITVRGIKVLSKAKFILCEDGKITSKLLNLLNIDNKPKYINLVRNNKFNESGVKLALSEIHGQEILKKSNTTVKPLNQKAVVGKLPLEKKWKLGLVPSVASPRQEGLAANLTGVIETQKWSQPDSNLSNTGTGSFTSFKIQNLTDLETDQKVIAIVTDAGTPGISDPAFEVIQLLQELQLDYTVLPGATACIPAIVASNLISKEFTFLGFLPLKKGRQTIWKEISQSKYPIVIYESCHRIAKFVEELKQNIKSETRVSISQEISKKHENTWIGTVEQINEYTLNDRGEFVVIINN